MRPPFMKGGNWGIHQCGRGNVTGFNEAALHEGRKYNPSSGFPLEYIHFASMRPPFMKGGNIYALNTSGILIMLQ